MNELETAVKKFCEFLPYVHYERQPHDDSRLYTISYWCVKLNKSTEEVRLYLEEYLPQNENINICGDALNDYISSLVEDVKKGVYILDRIKGFLK